MVSSEFDPRDDLSILLDGGSQSLAQNQAGRARYLNRPRHEAKSRLAGTQLRNKSSTSTAGRPECKDMQPNLEALLE
eukprot:1158572-Pelagomonas_calceolata.AAC.11